MSSKSHYHQSLHLSNNSLKRMLSQKASSDFYHHQNPTLRPLRSNQSMVLPGMGIIGRSVKFEVCTTILLPPFDFNFVDTLCIHFSFYYSTKKKSPNTESAVAFHKAMEYRSFRLISAEIATDRSTISTLSIQFWEKP